LILIFCICVLVGESFQELKTGGAALEEGVKENYWQGDELWLWHVDRLAISAGCVRAAGQVPLHPPVHLPICLLHGARIQKRARKSLKIDFFLANWLCVLV
jgi:hypothetical protein